MAKLSDVALALQLQAEARSDQADVTIIHRKVGASRRRIAAGEQWRRGRLLGEGGYGQVYLEECIDGGNAGHVRAVKKLQKARNENYHHELNALALFSLGKVRCERIAEYSSNFLCSTGRASSSVLGGMTPISIYSCQWNIFLTYVSSQKSYGNP